ncbi:MAG TPA: ABC transporter permease [Feifaniaceae bacterium]|nr:ABC transporter permease [Feifaniaceae bacterium]
MEKKSTARVLLEKFVDVRESGVLMPLLLAVILFSANSDKFLTVNNMSNVMRTAAFTIITSIGQAFLIIAGSWDISVGAVFSLGGVAAASLMTYSNLPIWLAVAIALIIGALVGAFNGFLVQVIKLPPFIATMGSMYAARGLCTGYTKGVSVYPLPEAFLTVGQKGVLIGNYELPYVVVIALAMAVLAGFILRFTTYGRKLYAAGGNGEAARLSGIPTVKIRFSAFVLTGVLAALTGVLMASRVGSAQPNIGSGFEMTVVAACVIGGISMDGGAGSIIGVVMGSFFMAMISNGMTLVKIDAYWQQLVIGLVLIFACSLEYVRNRIRASLSI